MDKNKIINEFLKEAYRAVPKNVSLDGNILLEVHDNIGNMLDKYALDKSNSNIESDCAEWIHEERVKMNDDTFCPICGKKLQNN